MNAASRTPRAGAHRLNARQTFGAVLIAGALVGAIPRDAAAHHGSAISYDITKQETLTGIVTEWVWRNPHCFVMFDVSDPEGKVVNWGAETHPTNFLIRNEVSGMPVPWSATTLKPGDKVTITLFPSRVGAPRGLLAKVVTADGTVLLDDGDVRAQRRQPTQ